MMVQSKDNIMVVCAYYRAHNNSQSQDIFPVNFFICPVIFCLCSTIFIDLKLLLDNHVRTIIECYCEPWYYQKKRKEKKKKAEMWITEIQLYLSTERAALPHQ